MYRYDFCGYDLPKLNKYVGVSSVIVFSLLGMHYIQINILLHYYLDICYIYVIYINCYIQLLLYNCSASEPTRHVFAAGQRLWCEEGCFEICSIERGWKRSACIKLSLRWKKRLCYAKESSFKFSNQQKLADTPPKKRQTANYNQLSFKPLKQFRSVFIPPVSHNCP